jgi:hypothetical protein
MLLSIARRLPSPVKTFLKSQIRTRRRRNFAMSYYQERLNFIRTWAKKDTEDANFYYKLTDHNRGHLAHLIACMTGYPYSTITSYFDELENDDKLRSHISNALKSSSYGRDIIIDFGRRLGWYAFARTTKPQIIVETGVDHGVGSCVLASALLRNATEGYPGRYYGTDINPNAGKLFCDEYATTGKILYGDSIESLKKLNDQIDLFVNDSDHSADYEYNEYLVIADKLSERSLILGDNAHVTDSLSRFSVKTNRQFVFFSEKPANHWYPGAGIGISFNGTLAK